MRNTLAILSLLTLAPVAYAQAVPDPIQFVVAPETPGPNEQVMITVEGVGTFLGDATITWTKDGKVALSGAGERSLLFTTSNLGTATRISVTVKSSTVGTITRDFTFIPSLVNLLWEAKTTTPTFYRGKALYSAGSDIKVMALPVVVVNGSRASVSSLSYQWSRGGDPVPEASGLGRNTFSFSGDQLKTEEDISLDINFGNIKVAHGEVVIPAVSPQILLYERNALRGEILDQAFPPSISLAAKEITIQAEPFFFSKTSQKSGSLAYSWTLDDVETSGPEAAKGILTLRQSGAGVGSAALGVTLQNNDVDAMLQSAGAQLQLLFGQTQNSTFSQ